jgi:hypothetical protein
MKTYSKLLDELYAKTGPEKYEAARAKIADIASDSVKSEAAIRDKAFTAYCVSEQTYNKQWRAAWDAASAKVLAAEGIE